ncbi:MAG: hypothetical protein AAF958_15990 [Planctomycetota bacterium]
MSRFSQLGPIAGAAGAAVSATGIGLVITGGVLQVIGTVKNGRAAISSHRHAKGLQEIQSRASSLSHLCSGCSIVHDKIASEVLPYIIAQKQTKRFRRGVMATPGISLLESIRAVGKKGYKFCRGTLGVKRAQNAELLAKHLIEPSFGCVLVQEIVMELFDEAAMDWMLAACTTEVAAGLIAEKLKSR